MDIFTTALTRVVPVPIKPADLKVKPLAKTSVANEVSDDAAGLEEPAFYHNKPIAEKSPDKDQSNESETPEAVEVSKVPEDNTGQHIDVFEDSESSPVEEKDGKRHLDIFV